MTTKEADHCLEYGCPHNAFSDDVCGACAKDILATFRGESGKGCGYCGNRDHTSPEHVEYMKWMGDDPDED